MPRVAGTVALAVLVVIATCAASCSGKNAQPKGMDLANMQISPATTSFCEIDAVKMCQAEGRVRGAVAAALDDGFIRVA